MRLYGSRAGPRGRWRARPLTLLIHPACANPRQNSRQLFGIEPDTVGAADVDDHSALVAVIVPLLVTFWWAGNKFGEMNTRLNHVEQSVNRIRGVEREVSRVNAHLEQIRDQLAP